MLNLQEKFKSVLCSVMHNVVSSDKHTIFDIIRVSRGKKFLKHGTPR